MFRKAGQKLSALLRLCPYLDTNKKKTIYASKIKSFAQEGQITLLTKSKKERFV